MPRPGQLTVSVAMATHNGERFLGEQLASLATQTRLPSELVVVDDCSADASVSIAEKFAETAPFPVKILVNAESQRHGATFFRAVAECTGDLIAFCDQDDVWREEKIARCATVFEQRDDVALVVHAGRVVDAQLRATRVRIPDIRRRRLVAGTSLSPWFIHRGFALVIPRWLRDLYAVSERPRPIRKVEDRPMNHDEWACFLAPGVGSVGFVPEELVAHRRHGGNFSVLDAPGAHVPGPLRRVRGGEASVKVMRPALGGTRGIAGLFDVDAKTWRYEDLAARCREGAEFLKIVGSATESSAVSAQLSRRAAQYLRAERVLEARAEAVSPRQARLTRVTRVARLVADGGYGRRAKGGIGPLSLPLDLVLAIGPTPRTGSTSS